MGAFKDPVPSIPLPMSYDSMRVVIASMRNAASCLNELASKLETENVWDEFGETIAGEGDVGEYAKYEDNPLRGVVVKAMANGDTDVIVQINSPAKVKEVSAEAG